MYKFRVNIDRFKHKYVRFKVAFEGRRLDLYTNMVIEDNQWNERYKEVKPNVKVGGYYGSAYNKELREMRQFIDNYFNDCTSQEIKPNLDDLKISFESNFRTGTKNQSSFFFEQYDVFIKEKSSYWKDEVKNNHIRLKNQIREILPDISFSTLSTVTMNKIVHYFLDDRKIYNDSLIKRLTWLKQFVTWAEKRGCKVNKEYKFFEIPLPKAQKAVRFLEADDVACLLEIPYTPFSTIDNIRNMFVFMCFTGLRYSDAVALKENNITKRSDGKYTLAILTKKDRDTIQFKLGKKASEIYEKYRSYEHKSKIRKKNGDEVCVFPECTNKHFNETLKVIGNDLDECRKKIYLKKLGKKEFSEADLVEYEKNNYWIDHKYRLNNRFEFRVPKNELSSHCARRTFVSIAMNENVSLDLIAKITSHSDVNIMKAYAEANDKGKDIVIDALDDALDKSADKIKDIIID